MFDINELEGKTIINYTEDRIRELESLESGKSIYLVNTRTKDKFKITFRKKNGKSYKVIVENDEKDDKPEEYTLLMSGITFINCNSIISLLMPNGKLNIIAAEEFNIFE